VGSRPDLSVPGSDVTGEAVPRSAERH